MTPPEEPPADVGSASFVEPSPPPEWKTEVLVEAPPLFARLELLSEPEPPLGLREVAAL